MDVTNTHTLLCNLDAVNKVSVSKPVYMDYNATTPVRKEVAEAMLPFLFSEYGNPSSRYDLGCRSKDAIATARDHVADAIGATSSEVFFTSGSTESINWALKGHTLAARNRRIRVLENFGTSNTLKQVKPFHIITCATEHIATLSSCRFLESEYGFDLTILDVGSDGLLCASDVAAAVRPETLIVSIMRANNETGVLQPIKEIAAACKAKNSSVLIHTDASQAVGKIPVFVDNLGVDMLTIAGHKLYAPKGVGVLYVRKSACTGSYLGAKDVSFRGVSGLQPLLHGGGQESGSRAGTENVLLAVGLGKALELATTADALSSFCTRMASLRKRLIKSLKMKLDTLNTTSLVANAKPVTFWISGPKDNFDAHFNVHDDNIMNRLPNTCHFCFEGNISGGEVLRRVDGLIMASAQSACHAMDVSSDRIGGAMRLSLGIYTTEAEVDFAVQCISEAAINVNNEMFKNIESKSNNTKLYAKSDLPKIVGTRRDYWLDTYQFEATAEIISINKTDYTDRNISKCTHEIITKSTIFHPQGGGQPSDEGLMYTMKESDLCFNVKKVVCIENDIIIHYGDFNECSESNIKDIWRNGTVVVQKIDSERRKRNAKLHSAGHLIDVAMKLAGQNLIPSKGYHFPLSPYVEYIGKIPVNERNDLKQALQHHIDLLISANIKTKTTFCATKEECEKLCSQQSVKENDFRENTRVINVGDVNLNSGCPCGGTHINSTIELNSLIITKIKVKGKNTRVSYKLGENDT